MSGLLYSVRKIFSSLKYNIPNYQRGYKWTKGNIEVLLNDLRNFFDNNQENGKYYCLQNITICKNGSVFNLIDGQQRITTLYVLLAFFNYQNASLNFNWQDKLDYSIKHGNDLGTDSFIKENIVTGKIWKSEDKLEPKHKDEFYLIEVCDAIKKWFNNTDEQGRETNKQWFEKNKELYTACFLDRVKLIVNDVSESNSDTKEQQLFANINGAKVNLDGADLMRAVLITRSAKEKYIKNNDDNLINEFRVRMGIEIDDMNRWWSQPNVKTFFKQLLPEDIFNEAKGSFNIEAFPINLLYMLYYESKKNDATKQFSFRYFEYGIDSNGISDDNHYEMYSGIRKLHNEMQDWYEDKQIYNYLGFLFYRCKGRTLVYQKRKVTINYTEIYKLWNEEIKNKKEFSHYLKRLIINSLCSDYVNKDDNSNEDDGSKNVDLLCNDIKNIKHDWYETDNERLINVLVLQDILISNSTVRIPARYFTSNDEDKEHINAQTLLEDSSECKKADVIKYIDEMNDIDNELNNILITVENYKGEILDSEEKRNTLRQLNAIGLNSIGNIVLLDLTTNRSYHNNPYNEKRAVIITNYFKQSNGKKEIFIRPFTLKVFIKGNSGNEVDRFPEKWTIKDIRDNAKTMAESLKTWVESKE